MFFLDPISSFLCPSDDCRGRRAALARDHRSGAGGRAEQADLPADQRQPCRLRQPGQSPQIAAKYGALDIVAHKVGDGQATTGFKIMTDLVPEHPELRGVFVSNPVMAQGAGQAVAENKTNKTGDKINLVGFDWDDKLVKF